MNKKIGSKWDKLCGKRGKNNTNPNIEHAENSKYTDDDKKINRKSVVLLTKSATLQKKKTKTSSNKKKNNEETVKIPES